MAPRARFFPFRLQAAGAMVPGTLVAIATAAAALMLEQAEAAAFGHAWIEALVLAILLGTLIRSVWQPPGRFRAGIAFSGKYWLEIAVVLLGATISSEAVLAVGAPLLIGIALLVSLSILFGYAIGRLLGLPARLSLLIACGNSICGNSAIAAVAPVIGADGDEVATSIAFTAVLGVAVVVALPLLAFAIGFSAATYGAFAGLLVYAVPQVIAAAAPLGSAAVQMGTLVKLVRVLMLGPVCLAMALVAPLLARDPPPPEAGAPARRIGDFVPWFIIGFLLLLILRSAGLVPAAWIDVIAQAATLLTVVAMAALGLMTDIRKVRQAGSRVIVAVTLSLAALAVASYLLLRIIGWQ